MFQLDQAIGEWRRDCCQGGAISESSAVELEDHLRDSIERLCGSGLSEEEAFLVACHRLGKPSQLQSEFSKVHQGRIWLSRVILMLGGYLAISLLLKLIAFDQAALGFVGMLFDWDSTGVPISTTLFSEHFQHHWSALLAATAGLLGLGLMVWLLISFSRGPGRTVLKSSPELEGQLFGYFNQAPGSIGKLITCWGVLYLALSAGQMILSVASARLFTAQDYGTYMASLSIYSHGNHFITVIVLLVLTALLCRRYRRLSSLPG